MPELPEIVTFARDMKRELAGRTIAGVEVLQPKCLNLPEDDFVSGLQGARILDVTSHGKWIKVALDDGWLLLNLGMGGEVLVTDRDHLPEKRRLILELEDGASLAINFWKSISETLLSPRSVASL
jgi:formamidopyrimidine-DNA glycosylase